jgi:hypothetical protein
MGLTVDGVERQNNSMIQSSPRRTTSSIKAGLLLTTQNAPSFLPQPKLQSEHPAGKVT